jgi:hypothetical protein
MVVNGENEALLISRSDDDDDDDDGNKNRLCLRIFSPHLRSAMLVKFHWEFLTESAWLIAKDLSPIP